jgi:hypothetical protein
MQQVVIRAPYKHPVEEDLTSNRTCLAEVFDEVSCGLEDNQPFPRQRSMPLKLETQPSGGNPFDLKLEINGAPMQEVYLLARQQQPGHDDALRGREGSPRSAPRSCRQGTHVPSAGTNANGRYHCRQPVTRPAPRASLNRAETRHDAPALAWNEPAVPT